jgi:hypothetical protein
MPGREILISSKRSARSSVNKSDGILFPLGAHSEELASVIEPHITNSCSQVHDLLDQRQLLSDLVYVHRPPMRPRRQLPPVLAHAHMSGVEIAFVAGFCKASAGVPQVPGIDLRLVAHGVEGVRVGAEGHGAART